MNTAVDLHRGIARLRRQLDILERTPRYRPGELREIRETDAAGRTIHRFEGDPHACWAPFVQPVRHLTRIIKNPEGSR